MTMLLERAFASTREVLAQVRAEHLDSATPCASWDVRALIEHFVGTARWGAASVAGTEPQEYALDGRDLLTPYDESRELALAAFGAEGALDRTLTLPFGEFTGADLLAMITSDQFTHGWDLARALGRPTDLDPELATEVLAKARVRIREEYRGVEGVGQFGPAVEPPAGASPADRLAAFLGRTV